MNQRRAAKESVRWRADAGDEKEDSTGKDFGLEQACDFVVKKSDVGKTGEW